MNNAEAGRGVAAALSRRLRAAGLSSRRTGASLGHGFTIEGRSDTCVSATISIYGHDEDDATSFRDEIVEHLTEWAHPFNVGPLFDDMETIGYWTLHIHVEGLGHDFIRCGAAEATKLRARAELLDALAEESEDDSDPLHGQRANLEAKASRYRERANRLDP